MLKFLSYGESLVDFLPSERGPLRDVDTFTKTVGGAPTNAAVALARLHCDVALFGMVGDDEFGHFVAQKLAQEGVDSSFVCHTKKAKTGITFITLDHNGDRSFLFFREPSADLTIAPADIPATLFADRNVMLMGSNLLTEEPARSATFQTIQNAKKAGVPIVMDMNYRQHLWASVELARENISTALTACTIVKLNETELGFLCGTEDVDDPKVDALYHRLREGSLHTLLITLAEKGAIAITPDGTYCVDAPAVEVVDTTGAGDGFIAGFLTYLASNSVPTLATSLETLSPLDWERALQAGCEVGSRVCTQLGATPALPTRDALPSELFTWQENE